MSLANAGNVTIGTAAFTTQNNTDLVDAANGILTMTGTTTPTLDISVGRHATETGAGTVMEFGDVTGIETTTLDINSTAAIGNIVIDPNIRTKNANQVGILKLIALLLVVLHKLLLSMV